MITNLHIRNYALIEELDLSFDSGLTAITGETGAGKSIILGALGLILGNRADSKVLYFKDTNCIVEATFDISNYNYQSFFDRNDLEYYDELVVRREILKSGKSRSFINDSLVNLSILTELKGLLIDLHRQFDHLELFQNRFQLNIIDALAQNNSLKKKYTSLFNEHSHLEKELQNLRDQRLTAQNEHDFFLFQYEEFKDINLISGEQEERESELDKLNNSEEIKSTSYQISYNLEESENSLTGQLRELSNKLSSVASFDPKLETIQTRLESIIEELRDVSTELAQTAESVEYDSQLINEHEERLDRIYKLQKKHQKNSVDELIQFQEELVSKISRFQNLDEDIISLENKLSPLHQNLINAGNELSDSRKKVSNIFEKNVEKGLKELGMEHSQIKVEITPLESPSSSGLDEIKFLFSPNKGSQFMPLKNVASGGETSRLTLIIKTLVAGAMTMPTMIFDEIDLGISGEIANKMGIMLKKLAEKHQLIIISHSAQISAKSDNHYYVYKKETKERVITGVNVLDIDSRIQEIAKMLSGDPPSSHAIANAKELLN